MAEKKPAKTSKNSKKSTQKKDQVIDFTKPKPPTARTVDSYIGESTYSPYAEDLVGVYVYGGTRPKKQMGKGFVGPVAQEDFNKTGAGMLNTLLNKRNGDPWLIQLQEKLFTAGFYGNASRDDIAWGRAGDMETISAYKEAIKLGGMLLAAGNKITLPALLDQLGQRRSLNAIRGGGGGAAPKQPIRLTNAQDIEAAFDKTAPSVIGRALSAAEKQQLVAAYHSLEGDYQRTIYAGGTAANAPNLGAFAEKKAAELHPEEAKDYAFLGYAKQFYEMLGGMGG